MKKSELKQQIEELKAEIEGLKARIELLEARPYPYPVYPLVPSPSPWAPGIMYVDDGTAAPYVPSDYRIVCRVTD